MAYIENAFLRINETDYELVDEAGRDSIAQVEIKTDTALNNIIVGKQKLADAITYKKVPTEATDSFDVMAQNIRNIKTGAKEAVGTGYNMVIGSYTYQSSILTTKYPWVTMNEQMAASLNTAFIQTNQEWKKSGEQDWHIVTRVKILNDTGRTHIFSTDDRGMPLGLYLLNRDKLILKYSGGSNVKSIEITLPIEVRGYNDFVIDFHYKFVADGQNKFIEIRMLDASNEDVINWVTVYSENTVWLLTDRYSQAFKFNFITGPAYESNINYNKVSVNTMETCFVDNGVIAWGNSSYFEYPQN